eukprot:COSAG06_NODE_35484_length_459_cov_1.455556_1_plen_27_part_01
MGSGAPSWVLSTFSIRDLGLMNNHSVT